MTADLRAQVDSKSNYGDDQTRHIWAKGLCDMSLDETQGAGFISAVHR